MLNYSQLITGDQHSYPFSSISTSMLYGTPKGHMGRLSKYRFRIDLNIVL